MTDSVSDKAQTEKHLQSHHGICQSKEPYGMFEKEEENKVKIEVCTVDPFKIEDNAEKKNTDNLNTTDHTNDVFSISSVFRDYLGVTQPLVRQAHSETSIDCYSKQSVRHCAVNVENIITWVSYIQPECNKSNRVILFIPGNPGAIELYDKFLECLYKEVRIPIFGISHAGHDLIPQDSRLFKRVAKERFPEIKPSNKHTFTLEEQISHKLAFIRQYIKSDHKIIIVAHSLGSYVTLKMLNQMTDTSQILLAVLLFPVFERTMETTSGRFWVPMTQIMKNPLVTTTSVMERLPPFVKKTLIDALASRRKCSCGSVDAITEGIKSVISPNGLRNIAQIAKDLSKIGHHNLLKDVIKDHADKLTFYYGASDAWTPLSFYADMKKTFPDVDIRLDANGIGHAFIFNTSKKVAAIVVEIINKKIMEKSSACAIVRNMTFSLKRSKSYMCRRPHSFS